MVRPLFVLLFIFSSFLSITSSVYIPHQIAAEAAPLVKIRKPCFAWNNLLVCASSSTDNSSTAHINIVEGREYSMSKTFAITMACFSCLICFAAYFLKAVYALAKDVCADFHKGVADLGAIKEDFHQVVEKMHTVAEEICAGREILKEGVTCLQASLTFVKDIIAKGNFQYNLWTGQDKVSL